MANHSYIVTRYGFLLDAKENIYPSACAAVQTVLKKREGADRLTAAEIFDDMLIFAKAWEDVGGFIQPTLQSGKAHSATILSILLSMCSRQNEKDRTIVWKDLLEEEYGDMCTIDVSQEDLEKLREGPQSTPAFFANLYRNHSTSAIYSIMEILFANRGTDIDFIYL